MAPDEGPPTNYGNDSLGRIKNHFASVLDQKTKANALVEWPILKTYLLARRKNHEGKLKSFHDVVQDPEEISNVLVIVEVMIIISPSAAGCERSFHLVNEFGQKQTANKIARRHHEPPSKESRMRQIYSGC